MASICANWLEQKKAFVLEKSSTPTGLIWDTNMATVSLFWDTNLVAVTSCQNTLYTVVFAVCFGFKEKTFVRVIWVNPFKTQYPLTNSPNWSLGISIDIKLREFDKRSRLCSKENWREPNALNLAYDLYENSEIFYLPKSKSLWILWLYDSFLFDFSSLACIADVV